MTSRPGNPQNDVPKSEQTFLSIYILHAFWLDAMLAMAYAFIMLYMIFPFSSHIIIVPFSQNFSH